MKSKKVLLLAVVATIAVLVTGGSINAATIQYEYDALNRLIRVIYNANTRIEYTYDAAGNRTQRVSYVEGQVNIDIYPYRTPNRVFLSRNYTLYVVVLGSASFNVTTLNSSTVKFGKTGTEASPVRLPLFRDLNRDGYLDAMYGFRTLDCGFVLGDTQGKLKGSTVSGAPAEGSDSVLVSP